MRVVVVDVLKVHYESAAQEVVLPGISGELSVLDYHEDFLCSLGKGDIYIRKGAIDSENNAVVQFAFPINRGVAKMFRNELVVLVEKS